MGKFPSIELSRLPKLAPADLRLLWVNDWYDGHLEALVEHAGERCLMVLHHHDLDSERPDRWVLFRLTPEQLADEVKWHLLFAEHVGDHWCFHGETLAPHPPQSSRTPRSPDTFYAAHRNRPPIDLTTSAAVGWTDEMPKG